MAKMYLLKKLKEFKQTLRQESLADQLAFMYIPEPYTMYNEFFKLEPGVCKVYIDGKEVKSSNLFKHLEEPLYFSTEEDAITCFRDSFSKAVKRQLISDVPVSLFLSGGLDSRFIASKLKSLGYSNLHSFSYGPKGNYEAQAAKKVAAVFVVFATNGPDFIIIYLFVEYMGFSTRNNGP